MRGFPVDQPVVTGNSYAKFLVVRSVDVLDWLPLEEPHKGENFCGVDRSSDPITLAGIRQEHIVGGDIRTIIESATRRIDREGGRPDYCALPPDKFAELEIEMGLVPVFGGAPRTAIILTTLTGRLFVEPDPYLSASGIVLETDTWRRAVDLNGSELTVYCSAPGHNARINLMPYGGAGAITEFNLVATCTCGAHAVGSRVHSSWCDSPKNTVDSAPR